MVPIAPSQIRTRSSSSDKRSCIEEKSNIIFRMKDILIVSGKRTPMGEYGGALRDFSALELGAIAARAAVGQSGFEPGEFDHAILVTRSRPAVTPYMERGMWR